ncbi:hypothetical protein C8R45DRAFT_1109415 [Mycena sanguinolenta]|nr:hypothetical protein C8R45DRAFT_1109415 [Mycena sanguinolenta]
MLVFDHKPFKWRARQVLVNLGASRSRQCPLSINFDRWIIDPQDVTETLSILAPHLARCENLVISLSIPPPFKGPLPCLRRLDLSLHQSWLYQDWVAAKAFCDAPLLRTVLLNGPAARLITFPWAQLTSLALRDIRLGDCVPVLQHTANFLHCDLNITVPWNPMQDQNLPIVLPFLQSLRLQADFKPGTGFLDTFNVPALRRLRVPESLLHNTPIDSLKSFISKTGCQLQELCVAGIRIVADFSYREAFPSIIVSVDNYTISLQCEF